MTEPDNTLRHFLRHATASAHDTLDHSMREQGGWANAADYARFLSLQLAARIPVEAWLDAHAPSDLHPPAQSPLIASDLAELGRDAPAAGPRFAFAEKSEAACLGAAWVLAGSSLGNRSILAELQRRGEPASAWPASFLGDDAMLSFWKRLKGRIERPVSKAQQDAAARGARAVFEHFIAHTASGQASPAERFAQAS